MDLRDPTLGHAENISDFGEGHSFVVVQRHDGAFAIGKFADLCPHDRLDLAVLHERGRGTEPDPVEAVRWYEMAALQGYRPSQFNLAVAHARGAGTPRDMGKAVAWFERAAEQVPQANYALGEIFEDGAGGIGKDLERARSHYLLAELGGDARATARLTELTPEAVERGTLREIQEQLARLRIEPGGTDGRMGQRTAAAIRRFQKSAGLPEDGKPGQALLERLRATPAPR